MKKITISVLALIALMSLALGGCKQASSPTTPTTGKLSITKSNTLAGYTLSAAVVASKDLDPPTYSPGSDNVTTDITALTGKAAYLDADSGNVTPLGSTPASITIDAADSSGNTGSIQLTTNVIDFAAVAPGKVWYYSTLGGGAITIVANTSVSSEPNTAYSINLPATLDLSQTGLKTIVNLDKQFNAGYMDMGGGDPCVWFAIDNQIYLGWIHSSQPSVPAGCYSVSYTYNGVLYWIEIMPVTFGANETTMNFSSPSGDGSILVCTLSPPSQ